MRMIIELWLLTIPALDLLAASVLWWVVRGAGGWANAPRALIDRATAAILTWIGASLIAMLALLDLIGIRLAPDEAILVLAIGITMPSIASIFWLWRWVTGRF